MGRHQNTIQNVLLRLVICEPTTLETGCWEWSGSKDKGYGQVKIRGSKRKVHRVVYEHFVGSIPEGNELHHKCETRSCANFEHVEPLDPFVHVHLGNGITAQQSRQTHC